MATIEPFLGVHYDFSALGGDLSNVLAPPYDVLDRADKDRLLSASERNIVAVDLPHVPAKSLGPAEAYDKAGQTLAAWMGDGSLVQGRAPAIYVYHQVFEHDGRCPMVS